MSLCHHDHSHGPDKGEKTLNLAILANVLLTVVQIISGLISGSLSLIADSIHNLSDAAALVVASMAIKIGKRPADSHKTFGYRRAETVAALINFVVLVSIGVFLCIEAIDRFMHPEPVEGVIVMVIATIALIIDVFTAVLIFRNAEQSMNIKAAMLHNIADALSSLAVLFSGLLIYLYDWNWIDPVLTLLIAVYIISHGLIGLPKAVHLLMDGTPEDIDIAAVAKSIEAIDGVSDSHHLHIWRIDEWRNALEAHVVIKDLSQIEPVKFAIKKMLKEEYKIIHSTLEFEDAHHDDDCLNPDDLHNIDCKISH